MKLRKFSFCLVIAPLLAGCSLFPSSSKTKDTGIPSIDNSKDLTPVSSEDGETYYQSAAIDLVTEVNGNYSTNRPFTLDEKDDTKRIYHQIYFYEEDYFQVLYYRNPNGLGDVYAVLTDESDHQYAEIKKTEKGTPYQIDIIQDGIYDLILDTKTLGIDMVRTGDIETPVYETIKTCQLGVFVSKDNSTKTAMTLDEETNEYVLEKDIPLGSTIYFTSASGNSRYKMSVDPKIEDRLVYCGSATRQSAEVHVGGKYEVRFHAKEYSLKLTLLNPDTASYYCQVGWQEGKELTADPSAPYLFHYEFLAEGTPDNPRTDLPSFFPKLGMPYRLSVIDPDRLTISNKVLNEPGTYDLAVNLKDFSLTVSKK